QLLLSEPLTGRIMQIRGDDQAGARRYAVADTAVPRESLDVGPVISGGRKQWLINRMFDQHFITGLDESGHRDEVRHRRAGCCDDTVRWYAAVHSDRLLQRLEAIRTGASDLDVFKARTEILRLARQDSTNREIESCWFSTFHPLKVFRAGCLHLEG